MSLLDFYGVAGWGNILLTWVSAGAIGLIIPAFIPYDFRLILPVAICVGLISWGSYKAGFNVANHNTNTQDKLPEDKENYSVNQGSVS